MIYNVNRLQWDAGHCSFTLNSASIQWAAHSLLNDVWFSIMTKVHSTVLGCISLAELACSPVCDFNVKVRSAFHLMLLWLEAEVIKHELNTCSAPYNMFCLRYNLMYTEIIGSGFLLFPLVTMLPHESFFFLLLFNALNKTSSTVVYSIWRALRTGLREHWYFTWSKEGNLPTSHCVSLRHKLVWIKLR